MGDYSERKTGNEPTGGISPAGARSGPHNPPPNTQKVPSGGVSPSDSAAGATGIPEGAQDEEPMGRPTSDRHRTETTPKVRSGDQNDNPDRGATQDRNEGQRGL